MKLSFEETEKMAFITKGYAYAYQVLGKYMWDSGKKTLTTEVLHKLDEVLSNKVYKKIWGELASKDKWFLQFIIRKDTIKGIIDVQSRGMTRIIDQFDYLFKKLPSIPTISLSFFRTFTIANVSNPQYFNRFSLISVISSGV